jgi:hypothetical protein
MSAWHLRCSLFECAAALNAEGGKEGAARRPTAFIRNSNSVYREV